MLLRVWDRDADSGDTISFVNFTNKGVSKLITIFYTLFDYLRRWHVKNLEEYSASETTYEIVT